MEVNSRATFIGWATGDGTVRAMLLTQGATIVSDRVIAITYDSGKPVAIRTEKETYHV
ncbi:hypothetical protein [Stenotrophomonas phage StenR_269]|nr:hypothetical protein [Stenotrophomonas phage StenR_269]